LHALSASQGSTAGASDPIAVITKSTSGSKSNEK